MFDRACFIKMYVFDLFSLSRIVADLWFGCLILCFDLFWSVLFIFDCFDVMLLICIPSCFFLWRYLRDMIFPDLFDQISDISLWVCHFGLIHFDLICSCVLVGMLLMWFAWSSSFDGNAFSTQRSDLPRQRSTCGVDGGPPNIPKRLLPHQCSTCGVDGGAPFSHQNVFSFVNAARVAMTGQCPVRQQSFPPSTQRVRRWRGKLHAPDASTGHFPTSNKNSPVATQHVRRWENSLDIFISPSTQHVPRWPVNSWPVNTWNQGIIAHNPTTEAVTPTKPPHPPWRKSGDVCERLPS